jgi:16S rRNA (adenine1518-N6/adenine1519-N6)-dimethyltransferase
MQHRAKKRLGQNFLVDQFVIQRIVDSIRPEENDTIIEIGPGLGALTKPILNKVKQLDVIEFDREIIPKLQLNCSFNTALTIHEMDVLKFDFTSFQSSLPTNNKIRVIGNLPYNISTPVLFHLLKHRHAIRDMYFMLQKEVVDRITSPPGNKCYGRLSVMIQSYFDVTPLFIVPPHSFEPAPKVESAVLKLKPISHQSDDTIDYKILEELVRTAFSQRRKTLKNTLKDLCTLDQLNQIGIDPTQRAETVPLEAFIELHKLLKTDKNR